MTQFYDEIWIVASITFLTLLAAAGMRSTPGVLIVPYMLAIIPSCAPIQMVTALILIELSFNINPASKGKL